MVAEIIPGTFLAEDKKVRIKFVDKAELWQLWPIARPLLEGMQDTVGHLAQPDDIPPLLFNGSMQLWLIGDEDGFFFAVITQFSRYPRGGCLFIFYAGGSRAKDAVPMLEVIEMVAFENGLHYSQISGRSAWRKLLEPCGYVASGIVLEKTLGERSVH